MADIRVRRVHEPASPDDGLRLLVDRLWPRGLRKDQARADRWLRDIAPGDALRRWFAHDPQKWDAFRRRYFAELDSRPEAVAELRALLAAHPRVTLLYAAKDPEHNNAQALAEYLRGR